MILASAGDTSESFGSPPRAQSRSNKLLLVLAILCSVIGLTPEWNLAAVLSAHHSQPSEPGYDAGYLTILCKIPFVEEE